VIKRPVLFGSARLFFTNSILEREARGREKNYSGSRENSSKSTVYSFLPASIGLPPGSLCRKSGRKYGFESVGRARMTNDALIAMSCASRGLVVQTKNPGDFKLIAQFRSFEWEVV
jgi:hypothetical protein